MKIAFASCFDALKSPVQPVWQRIKQAAPDVLLLLGDNIYMDFFPHLYQSTDWPPQRFADEMHRRYSAQWLVPGFRDLLSTVERVGAVWDDHDFAWNKSHGAGGHDKTFVEQDRRRIARALFTAYREALQAPEAAYPQLPPLDQLLNAPDTGIQDHFDFDGVRFILLDGRTFRTNEVPDAGGDLHGEAQRIWLADLVKNSPGVCIAASGSTLSHSKESWDNFCDYEWLMQQRLPHLLVLSGDIHSNKPRVHSLDGYTLYEATSSGVARRGLGGATGNFGLVTLHNKDALIEWFAEGDATPETTKNWGL